MKAEKKEKGKIYRFGNIILQYFPAVEKECVACYQLRTIQNDRRIEWDENTKIFGYIEYLIKEKGSDKKAYEYFGNMLLMYYNLSCEWVPTPEGLNIMAKAYIDDVQRLGKASKSNETKSAEEEETENQKIIEEEKKNYEMEHGEQEENIEESSSLVK